MRRRKFTVHLRDAGSLLFPCPPTQNENFQLPVLPVALVSDPIGRRGVVSIGSGFNGSYRGWAGCKKR